MKNKLISTLLLVVLLALLPACTFTVSTDDGKTVTENPEIGQIHALDFSSIGDLTITQGDHEALTITGEQNAVQHIQTKNNNGVLEISFDTSNWSNLFDPLTPIHYYLTVKDLNSIQLSGAGNIHADSLSPDSMSIDLTGAGNITIDHLQTQALSVTLSGAGNFDVSGTATNQDISLSGVGDYHGENLQSDQASVILSGAGSATVWAKTQLDVTISGAGSVNYYGNPTVSKTVSGVGSIKQLGTK
ncbi:MAG: head GIN domain-containing protein [Anaerolineaceae bacterium]|jgi:hypothetical protein